MARTCNVALLMIEGESGSAIGPVGSAGMRGVERALAEKAYSLTFASVRRGSPVPAVICRGDIDGLILHGNPPGPELADKLKRFPSVWFLSARSRSGYWGDRVSPDNGIVGQRAAEYFIRRGHRRIAFLGLDATHLVFPERLSHFQQTAAEADVDCCVIRAAEEPDHEYGDFQAKRHYIDQLIGDFAGMQNRPTGLFVPRGQAILMVFDSLRSHGIEPGRDVAIIACDNDPALAGLNPQIATIDVRPELIGRQAVEQLMLRIEKPGLFTRSKILIEPTLIVPADDHDGSIDFS